MSTSLSRFRQVYHFRDPAARGRLCILIFTVIEGILGYITTGVFYTVFLQGYQVNIIGAGILSFVPFGASLLVLFVPGLLNRFPRRKWLLAACKLAYYLLSIIGLTLLPAVVTDNRHRLVGMVILTFLSTLFNMIAIAGYNAWHIRFQPEDVRAYHISCTQLASNLVAGLFAVCAGWLCDVLPFSFILGLRYGAFGLGVLAVIFLLIPQEVAYPVVHTPRFSDVLTIPLGNRKFLLTMLIVFGWQFALNCSAAQTTYYLLDTIGMSTTFNTVILFLYGVAFILFVPFWQKRIRRTSWFSVYAGTLVVIGILQILYGFVQGGSFVVQIGRFSTTIPYYLPFLLVVILPKHVVSVGHNIAGGNLPYIHMPSTNRDCYTSFHLVVANLGSVAGMIFGIFFTEWTTNLSFTLFGYTYVTGTPLLMALSGVLQTVGAVIILRTRKHLEEQDADFEHA